MKLPLTVIDLYERHGIFLSQLNPGSSEIALPQDMALAAVDALSQSGIAVVGGDVLAVFGEKLQYAGENWHCNRSEGESDLAFAARSCELARRYIGGFAPDEATLRLFVLVLKE